MFLEKKLQEAKYDKVKKSLRYHLGPLKTITDAFRELISEMTLIERSFNESLKAFETTLTNDNFDLKNYTNNVVKPRIQTFYYKSLLHKKCNEEEA